MASVQVFGTGGSRCVHLARTSHVNKRFFDGAHYHLILCGHYRFAPIRKLISVIKVL